MKKEYDFSKGVRGKFYKKDIQLNIPVYLEDENLKFVEKIANKNNTDMNQVVNDLIKENIKIAQVLKWIMLSENKSPN